MCNTGKEKRQTAQGDVLRAGFGLCLERTNAWLLLRFECVLSCPAPASCCLLSAPWCPLLISLLAHAYALLRPGQTLECLSLLIAACET